MLRALRLTLLPALAACVPAASVARTDGAPPRDPAPPRDTVEIVVASTTDVHGRLRGWDYFADAPDTLRGLARAATIVDSVRQSNPGGVVLVDAGDLLQGNPLTYVAARVDTAGPHPVVAAMNALGYDAAALGNHEFNYGLPHLERALSQARFPFLAVNAYRPDGRRAFGATHVVERHGVRIGIVGATNPGAMIWDRDNLTGRLVVRDIVSEVRTAVAELRERADVVVVVMHSGLGERASYDTVTAPMPSENVSARVAREVPGIDLIVFGHSHRELADSVINGVLLVQPRNWSTSVSLATLRVVRDGGRWRVAARSGRIVQAAGHAESPAVVAATQRAHDATVRWVNERIGTTAVAWRADSARVTDAPLTDFILEVLRRTASADLAATAAFDINASLPPGAITVAQVARLYPYDNTLRAIRITGRQLRDFLEYSARYYRTIGTPEAAASVVDPSIPGYNFDIIAGADYTLDLSRPLGSRVTRLEVKGRPVADADTFVLALNNYRQTGGGGYAMLRDAPVVYDRQEEIRDLLIAEVRHRGTIRPEDYAVSNWKLEPASAVAQAYQAMHRTPFDAPGASAGRQNPLATGRWLRIISTNDFHGALEPRVDASGVARGGAAYLATAIARARAECPPPSCVSIWLDGGDEFQGTPGSNLAYGRSVVELFTRMGLTASALGNHEFDWGMDTLRARMHDAPYAILGANVKDTLGRDVPWIRNDTLVDLGNVKVGVIGISTKETPGDSRPSNVAGLRFVDPAPVVDEHARQLRARGADVVVVIAHAGGFCNRGNTPGRCTGEIIDMAQEVTERIDAVVSGHTHSGVATHVRGTPIVQAFSRGSAIGVIDLPLAGGGEPSVEIRNVFRDSLPPDAGVAEFVAGVLEWAGATLKVPVAEIAERMNPGSNGTLGNLIADAQRAVGRSDVGVMNRGGVRAPLLAGTATRWSLFEVQPFGNMLMRINVRGADLQHYLERLVSRDEVDYHLSGVRVFADRSRARGSRITRVEFADGRPFDPQRVYSVVMSDFMASGGDGLGVTERAISVEDLRIVDLDALVEYLHARPAPVRPPTDARLIWTTP